MQNEQMVDLSLNVDTKTRWGQQRNIPVQASIKMYKCTLPRQYLH